MNFTTTDVEDSFAAEAELEFTKGEKRTKKKQTTWPAIRASLHEQLVGGATTRELAMHFGVSIRTITHWKKALKSDLLASEELDSLKWLSERIATFKVMREEAWRNYERSESDAAKQRWFSLVLKAEIGLTNLMIGAGALEGKPLSPDNLKKAAQDKAGKVG